MQVVSESFKKAIKSDVREIYAYVDVVYDDDANDTDYSIISIPEPSVLSYPTGDDMFDGIKIMKNYATLENNYFLLNGSFMLANKSSLYDSNGFVSDKIFYEYNSVIFDMEVDNSSSKGVTLYIKDNLIFDFNIIITDINGKEHAFEIRNNDSYHPQIIFEHDIIVSNLKIEILKVEYRNRRIRIPEIDFSISDIYEGEELINLDITEEIDLLVESLPVNTCSININNYPDAFGGNKFDPLNPVGIVPYLTENAVIRPYIGVLTEENGIEYVLMGTFYLSDWSSDVDGNITINSKNLISRLNNIDFVSDGTLLKTDRTWKQMGDYLTNMTGFIFNFPNSGATNEIQLRHTNLGEWLLAQGPFLIKSGNVGRYTTWNYRPTRNNTFELKVRNLKSIDNISRNELIQDVKYETKTMINEVCIIDLTKSNLTSTTREYALDDNHTLSNSEEYVWYNLDKYTAYSDFFSYSVVSGNGKAELIDYNHYLLYIKFTGTPGSVINVKYDTYVFGEKPTKQWIFKNDLKNGDKIELDFHEYFDASDTSLQSSADYYLTEDKKYVVTANTIGDPSLEPGDTISIQTRYSDINDGYKDVVITKQKFTYNGGLSCELEGRGN